MCFKSAALFLLLCVERCGAGSICSQSHRRPSAGKSESRGVPPQGDLSDQNAAGGFDCCWTPENTNSCSDIKKDKGRKNKSRKEEITGNVKADLIKRETNAKQAVIVYGFNFGAFVSEML